jgi:uncharacterized delta-60 repeat protein
LDGTVYSVDVLSDGRILAGGSFTEYTAPDGTVAPQSYILLLEPDGKRVSEFHPEPDNTVKLVRGLGDDRILMVGWFDQIGDAEADSFAVLNRDGSLDTTFMTNVGLAEIPEWRILTAAELNDGSLLLGGTIGGAGAANLVKLDGNGNMIDSFQVTEGAANFSVWSISETAGGRIWISGNPFEGGFPNLMISQLEADGSAIAKFEKVGQTQDPVSLQPMGENRAWMGYTELGNRADVKIADSATMELVEAGPVLAMPPLVKAAIPLAGNKLMIGGNITHAGSFSARGLVVLDPDGMIESVPDLGGVESGEVNALLHVGNGEVLVGGWFRGGHAYPDDYTTILRLKGNGSVDEDFSENFIGSVTRGPGGSVTSLASGFDSSFYATGYFTAPNLDYALRLVRISADGTWDPYFAPDLSEFSYFPTSIVRSDSAGNVYVAGNPFGLRKLESDGLVDDSLYAQHYTGIEDVAIDHLDRLLVSLQWGSLNGESASANLYRFNRNSELDEAFSESGPDQLYPGSILVQPDGRLLVAKTWDSDANESNLFLGRRHRDGSMDHTFGYAGITGMPTAVAIRDDGRLFVANGRYQRSGFASDAAPPKLSSELVDLDVDFGESVTQSVNASGSGELSYQWYRDGEAREGAIESSLTVRDFNLARSGNYSVVVSSFAGSVQSSAELTLPAHDGGFRALQRLGDFDGSPTEVSAFTINNRLNFEGEATTISWTVVVPDGWTLEPAEGSGAVAVPDSATTELADWEWSGSVAGPIEFSYDLVPADSMRGRVEVAALVDATVNSVEVETMANPDPLYIRRLGADRHSADLDGDQRLSLSELLRVIELYNTRSGTSRNGRYRLSNGSADTFAPYTDDGTGQTAPLARFHAADTDRDAKLSLSELLRVIELYNTRSGTSRTGAYRVAEGTVDGFAAVSGGE